MTNEEIQNVLSAPFLAEDIEWRVQNTTKDKEKGMAVAYLTSRAIQKRLDDAVGPYNWKSEFKPWHQVEGKPSQICGLSIYDEARNEWITKWDGAENTDIESIKGGISDAFKRAAVLWGIGRYLYSIDSSWVEIEPSGKSFKIKTNELKKLENKYFVAIKGSPVVPSVISAVSNSLQKAEPKTSKIMDFDYVVKSVEQKKKCSIVKLTNPQNGNEIDAFLQGENLSIAQGVCLKDVKITNRPKSGTNPAYNTIDSYKIAA